VELCRSHGGRPEPASPRPFAAEPVAGPTPRAAPDATGRWRATFLRAPYLRDALARLGVVVETFETACTWTALAGLREAVVTAVATAGLDLTGTPALVGCRFSHVYPDGPAPYFTVYAAGRRGGEVEIWDALKVAASDAIVAAGGTITHHHAVGRDHRPWYDRERPDPFGLVLTAAKATLDPAGMLNPGVLLG
jgi:alkyldihydroxyacetonephosphate synthase